MKISYARVSARDQNLDLQVDTLKRGCERLYPLLREIDGEADLRKLLFGV